MSCLFVLCVCVCSFFTLVRSSFLLVSSSTLPHFLIFLILGIAAQNMSTTHPSHTYFIRCMVYEYFQSTHSRLMADRAKYNSHNKWTIKPKMKNTFHILICESISQSTPFILKRAKIERAITHTQKKNSVCPKQNEVEIECDIVTIQSVCGGAKKKSNSWLLWISNELRKSWLISGRLNIYNEFISQPLGFYLPFGDVELKEWPVLIWTRIQTVNDEHRTLCKVT